MLLAAGPFNPVVVRSYSDYICRSGHEIFSPLELVSSIAVRIMLEQEVVPSCFFRCDTASIVIEIFMSPPLPMEAYSLGVQRQAILQSCYWSHPYYHATFNIIQSCVKVQGHG